MIRFFLEFEYVEKFNRPQALQLQCLWAINLSSTFE